MTAAEAIEYLQINPSHYILTSSREVLAKVPKNSTEIYIPIMLIPELGKYFHVKIETHKFITPDYSAEVEL
jgi:hypothetical protein